MVTATTTVPAWVSHTTTFAAATVTVALIAALTAHIVIWVLDDGPQTQGAAPGGGAKPRRYGHDWRGSPACSSPFSCSSYSCGLGFSSRRGLVGDIPNAAGSAPRQYGTRSSRRPAMRAPNGARPARRTIVSIGQSRPCWFLLNQTTASTRGNAAGICVAKASSIQPPSTRRSRSRTVSPIIRGFDRRDLPGEQRCTWAGNARRRTSSVAGRTGSYPSCSRRDRSSRRSGCPGTGCERLDRASYSTFGHHTQVAFCAPTCVKMSWTWRHMRDELARAIPIRVLAVGNAVGVHLPVEPQEEWMPPALRAERPAPDERVVAAADDRAQAELAVAGARRARAYEPQLSTGIAPGRRTCSIRSA